MIKEIVVDDGRDFLNTCRIALRGQGYDIMRAKNSADAVDLMTEELPDAIFIDLEFSKPDAIEFCQLIKKEMCYPFLERLQTVIVLEQKRVIGSREDFIDLTGCSDYILKPVNIHQLYVTLQKMTEKYPRQALRSPINILVKYVWEGGQGDDFTNSLSDGGIFILTQNLLALDTEIDLSFTLPGNHKDISHTVNCRGRVAHIYEVEENRDRESQGMGVQFINCSQRDQMQIRKYVEKLLFT